MSLDFQKCFKCEMSFPEGDMSICQAYAPEDMDYDEHFTDFYLCIICLPY